MPIQRNPNAPGWALSLEIARFAGGCAICRNWPKGFRARAIGQEVPDLHHQLINIGKKAPNPSHQLLNIGTKVSDLDMGVSDLGTRVSDLEIVERDHPAHVTRFATMDRLVHFSIGPQPVSCLD